MKRKAISATLIPDNVSAVLDAVLAEARQGAAPARSVVGRVRFPEGEAGLERGEKELRQLFERSLTGGRSRPRRRG